MIFLIRTILQNNESGLHHAGRFFFGKGSKYAPGDAHMFLIEGMARVRKVIEANRKRKLTEPDADCSCCEHKSRCLYRYNAEKNPDRNKVMKNNERWEELREESNANIQKYH